MCGICGIVDFGRKPVESSHIQTMMRMMKHRGPDDEGFFINGNVGLGHVRLSILDLSPKGHQPMFSADRRYCIVYNGEVYNYQELRRELTQKYSFTSDTDTEVILHAYMEWGANCVQKLNGMFAFAIYDTKEGDIFLARDRLGIKPLNYYLDEHRLIFASELKPILSCDGIQRDIDFNALSTYLDIMYIPRPFTPFKGIHKLDSGTVMHYRDGICRTQKYWDPELGDSGSRSRKQILEEMEDIMSSAARMQLISHVPIGTYLSGGIDSSVVTAFAAKYADKNFTAVHMRWNGIDGKMDESGFASKVSERYNLQLYIKDIGDIDVIELIPQLLWSVEEPLGDAAFVNTYVLARIAAEKVKVILSGAGGDELFGGYPHHRRHPRIKSIIQKAIFNRGKAFSYYDIRKNSYQGIWKKLFPWYVPDSMKDHVEAKYCSNRNKDEVNAIMLNDLYSYLQDDILFLTDRMTMASSIECRVPILDHRLVELSLSIPSGLKIVNGEGKHILKELGKAYLPHEVLYRPKEGFGAPVWTWVNQNKDIYFDTLLEDGFLARHGLINKRYLRALEVRSRMGLHLSWIYWLIVVLEIWCRLFVENAGPEYVFDLN